MSTQSPNPKVTISADLEARAALLRAIDKCQEAPNRRFLEMILARVDERIARSQPSATNAQSDVPGTASQSSESFSSWLQKKFFKVRKDAANA